MKYFRARLSETKTIVLNLLKVMGVAIRNIGQRDPVVVTCLPRARRRYSRYYFRAERCLYVDIDLPSKLLLAACRFMLADKTSYVFSDYKLAQLPKAFRTPTKDTARFYMLAWNDEMELQEIAQDMANHNAYFTVLTLFEFPRDVLPPSFKFSVTLRPTIDASVTSGKAAALSAPGCIFFAGQVNTTFHMKELRARPALMQAAETVLARLLDGGPMAAFSRHPQPDFGLCVADWVKVRHFAVNAWRKALLVGLAAEFGDRLILCGPDFHSDIYGRARRMPYVHSAEELHALYRQNTVSLDCGSQCGLESLYPRSLEIIDVAPATLVQVALEGSNQIFRVEDGQDFRIYRSLSGLIAACHHMLALSPEVRQLQGVQIQKNCAAYTSSNAWQTTNLLTGLITSKALESSLDR